MIIHRAVKVEKIRKQIAVLDATLDTMLELKIRRIAVQTGVPMEVVRRAVQEGRNVRLPQRQDAA